MSAEVSIAVFAPCVAVAAGDFSNAISMVVHFLASSPSVVHPVTTFSPTPLTILSTRSLFLLGKYLRLALAIPAAFPSAVAVGEKLPGWHISLLLLARAKDLVVEREDDHKGDAASGRRYDAPGRCYSTPPPLLLEQGWVGGRRHWAKGVRDMVFPINAGDLLGVISGPKNASGHAHQAHLSAAGAADEEDGNV
ncbi:hypothetical protein DFH27DRAFT_609945 [Peziza echinospora]|nr:hypothetical protein DFH27DRAFT_609945 [Peziza echinospora]